MCAVISLEVRIGCDHVRHRFVARRWLLVARKKSLRYTMPVGFEARDLEDYDFYLVTSRGL